MHETEVSVVVITIQKMRLSINQESIKAIGRSPSWCEISQYLSHKKAKSGNEGKTSLPKKE